MTFMNRVYEWEYWNNRKCLDENETTIELKSHRIYLGRKYGRHFIVLGHQYVWSPWYQMKISIALTFQTKLRLIRFMCLAVWDALAYPVDCCWFSSTFIWSVHNFTSQVVSFTYQTNLNNSRTKLDIEIL